MAIQSSTFTRQFGNIGRGQRNDQEFEKAKFWLNVGYTEECMNTETGLVETRFISLAKGIPLDTMETFPTNSKNPVFAAMRAAQNDLRDQFVAAFSNMQPGDERIVGETSNGIQLQLRYANEERAEMKSAENPFIRKLSLVE